jgi:hypothetical protein
MGVGAPAPGSSPGRGSRSSARGSSCSPNSRTADPHLDNRTGELLVPRRPGYGAWSATLPYARIQGFEVHRKTVVTSGRSRSTEYTCSMVREDGARWASRRLTASRGESLCAASRRG